MNDTQPTGARSPDETHTPTPDAELFALLPAFVLGATDPDEAAFVRRHLTDAPGAEAELAAYTRLVDVLHFSAPLATPPPALEARLRAALTADPVHTQAAPSPIGRGRSWHWPRLALAAAAAMAVLLALNLWWTDQMTGLRTENAALQSQVTAQATALALQQDQLTTQQQQLDALYYQEAKLGRTIASQIDLLAQVVAVAGESYDMPPAQSDSPAFATVAWLDQPGVGVLRADNFPPLPPDMVYQFWLIKDGARTSGGLFTVDDAGRGSLIGRLRRHGRHPGAGGGKRRPHVAAGRHCHPPARLST